MGSIYIYIYGHNYLNTFFIIRHSSKKHLWNMLGKVFIFVFKWFFFDHLYLWFINAFDKYFWEFCILNFCMFLDYCTLFNGILDFFLIKTLNFCIILDFCILLLLTDNMQKSRFNCIFKIIYGKYLWDNAKSFMVNIYGNVWENHLYLYLNDGFQKVFIFIFIYPKKNHLYPTLLDST